MDPADHQHRAGVEVGPLFAPLLDDPRHRILHSLTVASTEDSFSSVEDEQTEQRGVTDPPTAAADTPTALAARYAAAWQAHDWPALRALLADDVTFRGPLGTADDADSCITGLQRMAQVLDHLEVHARASHGSDVLTWFDLHSTVAPPTPTANWTRVENGKITQIRVAFDPRALLTTLEASRDASAPTTGRTDNGQ